MGHRRVRRKLRKRSLLKCHITEEKKKKSKSKDMKQTVETEEMQFGEDKKVTNDSSKEKEQGG